MGNNIIYHYTSPEGLKSILESRSLRFTDYRFLNDKNEGLVINKTNCIETKIKDLLDKEKDDRIRIFLKKLQVLMSLQTSLEKEQIEKNNSGDIEENKYNYYVFSLSKEKDSLPMWNYYVKHKKYEGYNIGIDIEELKKIISEKIKNNKDIYKVYNKDIGYKYEEINIFIENIIKKFFKFCHKKTSTYDCASELITNYIFSKNLCFEHEKEYRFVLQEKEEENIQRIDIMKYEFFIKNGIFIPYMNVNLGEDIKKIIKSITIAPLVEKDIAKKGLEKFLINNGYKNIEIEISNCPIRY